MRKSLPKTTSKTLSRTSRARNAASHMKRDSANSVSKSKRDLDTICEKHKVGDLSFKESSCKLSDENGTVSYIDHTNSKGNMRCGVILLQVLNIAVSDTAIYDLVKIQTDKKNNDEKKRQEEIAKAKEELDNFNNRQKAGDNSVDDNSGIVTDTNAIQPTDEIIDDINIGPNCNSDAGTITSDTVTNDIVTNNSKTNPESESDTNTESDSNANTEEIHNKILETMDTVFEIGEHEAKLDELENPPPQDTQTKPVVNTTVKKEGNKHYRNFIKDLRDKFTLVEQFDYYYFETKVNVTDMVITNSTVYKLQMPTGTKHMYLLIVGDLQMKTDLIRRIDPAYNSGDIFRSQNDFLKRIEALEKLKTVELSEDIDMLGMPDDMPDLVHVAPHDVGSVAPHDVGSVAPLDTVPVPPLNMVPIPPLDRAILNDLLAPELKDLMNKQNTESSN